MCVYERANGQGEGANLVDDIPCEARDAANGWVGELVEGVGREVKVAEGAPLAAVHQLDFDGFTLVCGRRRGSEGLSGEKGEFYAQVTLAVLPHIGLLFGLPPA